MSGLLSADEVARFRRWGLVAVPDRFSSREIEVLGEALDRLRARAEGLTETAVRDGTRFVLEPTGPGGRPRVHRAVWCGAAEPELARLAEDPRVLEPAGQLLAESELDQLVNQAHFKEPGDGVAFPLHQDAWNRRYGTELWRDTSPDGGYVQVLLTVDPMTEANGPLLYVPGSHEMGPIIGDDRRARVDAVASRTPPEAVVAAPGTLVFFGPFLVHGSAPNRSRCARRVLVNGYARAGVNGRVYHGAGTGVRRRIRSPDEHPHDAAVRTASVTRLGT